MGWHKDGNPIETLFADEKYLLNFLSECRETFGLRSTTSEQYDDMQFWLSAALLYSPERWRCAVEATIIEAEMRRLHFELFVWRKHEEG